MIRSLLTGVVKIGNNKRGLTLLILIVIFVIYPQIAISTEAEETIDHVVMNLILVNKEPDDDKDNIKDLLIKLKSLNNFDKKTVLTSILKLAIKTEIEDRDKNYWEGNPRVLYLFYIYMNLVCDAEEVSLTVSKFTNTDDNEINEWMRNIKSNAQDFIDTDVKEAKRDLFNEIQQYGLESDYKNINVSCN